MTISASESGEIHPGNNGAVSQIWDFRAQKCLLRSASLALCTVPDMGFQAVIIMFDPVTGSWIRGYLGRRVSQLIDLSVIMTITESIAIPALGWESISLAINHLEVPAFRGRHKERLPTRKYIRKHMLNNDGSVVAQSLTIPSDLQHKPPFAPFSLHHV